MTEAPKVIIDTDPGIDDAIAILLALTSPRFDVQGVTTVAGNLGLRTTTRNAGRLLAEAGRIDVPVIAGASGPLTGPPLNEAAIHGEDGLGGVDLPEPQRPPLADDAAAWLAATLERHPPGTLDVLALGPLTNLAVLVRDAPIAARRIRRIIAMGGTIREPGNAGPYAEFNFAADADAAAILFASTIPLTLVPLDVTRRVRADASTIAALRALGGRTAATTATLIEAYFRAQADRTSRPLHDPCVMLLALAPELFTVEPIRLSVAGSADAHPGALTTQPDGAEINVAMGVQADAVLERLIAEFAQPASS